MKEKLSKSTIKERWKSEEEETISIREPTEKEFLDGLPHGKENVFFCDDNGNEVNESAASWICTQYVDYDGKVTDEEFEQYTVGNEQTVGQNSAYLAEVTDFIKQNKKCKVGTYDDTNACGPSDENIYKNLPVQLTTREKSLIAGYTHTSYAKVNYDLRHPNKAFRTEEDKKLVSDTITVMEKAINNSPLRKDMVLYRGMGDKFVADNFDKLEGSIIQDKGFISTTTDIDKAGQFAGVGKIETKSPKRIIAKITVPKGTNALRLGEYDESSPEKEYILQHGTSFKVNAVDKSGSYWRIDMEVVPSQKHNSTLTEVADFFKLNYKCRKEDSPDGSNKCPDTLNKSSINKFGIKPTTGLSDKNIAIAVKNSSIFQGLKESDFDEMSPDELDEFSKWSASEGVYKKIKEKYDKYQKALIERGEWRDEEHPSKWELGLNAKYLNEVASYLILSDAAQKLNSNCKDEEKIGTGPGSCSGGLNPIDNNKDLLQETYIGLKVDYDYQGVDLSGRKADLIKATNPKLNENLNKLSNDLDSKTTHREKLILRRYTNYGYYDINDYLSGKLEKESSQDSIKRARDDINSLDKIFKNANLPIPITTFRGIKDEILTNSPELSEALDTPGSEINCSCFSSSSVLPFVAENFASGYSGRMLEIHLPKGSKALYISDISTSPSEFEVLINRNTKFEVGDTKSVKIINPYKEKNDRYVKVTTLKVII